MTRKTVQFAIYICGNVRKTRSLVVEAMEFVLPKRPWIYSSKRDNDGQDPRYYIECTAAEFDIIVEVYQRLGGSPFDVDTDEIR